MLTDSDIILH